MANARIVNTPAQAVPQGGATHHQNTVSSTAEDLIDFTLQDQTTHVMVQFLGATARVTLDGATDPTASLGFEYVAGSSAYFTKRMAQSAKAIRAGGTDVVCEIQELNFL